MKHIQILALAVLIVLSACTNASTSEKVVTLEVDAATMPDLKMVLFQEEDSPWKIVQPTGNIFKISVGKKRFGLANVFSCIANSPTTYVTLWFFTVDEMSSFRTSSSCDYPEEALYQVNYHVSGLPTYSVYINNKEFFATGANPVGKQMYREGLKDIVAVQGAVGTPSKALILRNINPVKTKDVYLDFASPEALMLETKKISFAGTTGTRTPNFSTTLRTKNEGIYRQYPYDLNNVEVYTIPKDKVAEGDYYTSSFSVSNSEPLPNTLGTDFFTKGVSIVFQTLPNASTLTLPEQWFPSPSPSFDTSGGYPRFGLGWESYPNAKYYWLLLNHNWTLETPTESSWSALYSVGWLSGATGVKIPDFSKIEGWNSAWSPRKGQPSGWQFRAYSSPLETTEYFRRWAALKTTNASLELAYASKANFLTP